jgi:hypothetical protein
VFYNISDHKQPSPDTSDMLFSLLILATCALARFTPGKSRFIFFGRLRLSLSRYQVPLRTIAQTRLLLSGKPSSRAWRLLITRAMMICNLGAIANWRRGPALIFLATIVRKIYLVLGDARLISINPDPSCETSCSPVGAVFVTTYDQIYHNV